MSAPKFTPGPWRLDSDIGARNSDPSDARYILPSADGQAIPKDSLAICTVWACDEVGRDHDANARLIAAAPELYAALEQIVDKAMHNAGQLHYDDVRAASVVLAKVWL